MDKGRGKEVQDSTAGNHSSVCAVVARHVWSMLETAAFARRMLAAATLESEAMLQRSWPHRQRTSVARISGAEKRFSLSSTKPIETGRLFGEPTVEQGTAPAGPVVHPTVKLVSCGTPES